MKRCLNFLILLLLNFASGVCNEKTDAHGSVGLVLSGGGAKGIAHIGVIKALEDNLIPIDYIAGTSMGAIVGGLYACGYTTDEMLDLILSEDFGYWSTGTINPSLRFYLTRAQDTPSIFSIPIKIPGDTTTAVPQSLISPLPMNFAFMELFAPYTAQARGEFDNLMVPFRCVASDVAAKHKIVLSHGSVGDAIRASMSFPTVFQPTEIDGALLYDGGIYDNFPVDVMRKEFAPDVMIGVDVSTEETGPQTSIIDQLSNLIVQNNDYSLPSNEGIKIRIDLNEFGLLDFPKAREIYTIGYNKAISMIDSIKGRIHTRADSAETALRRSEFKSRTPSLRFDSVKISGGTKSQNDFIEYLFKRRMRHNTLSDNGARRAYYMALSTDKLRDLTLKAEYNDSSDMFRLNAKAYVKNNLKISAGGFLTSSNNSYIFLSTGYSTLSFNSISANINAWIGQSDMAAMVNGDIYLNTATPSRLTIQGVAERRKLYEDDYLFYEAKAPTFIIGHQYFGRMAWSVAAGYSGKFDIGVGYGHINDTFFRDNMYESYLEGRYSARQNLGEIYAAYSTNTLDDINFPTKGHEYFVKAMFLGGHFNLHNSEVKLEGEHSKPKWLQAEVRTRNYFNLNRHWSFGLESDVMLSTKKLYHNYNASIINAPSFNPTPASNNTFNPAFRANSFAALSVVPIYRYNDNISARLSCSAFMPLRKILDANNGSARYGKWLSHQEFFGEADITYHFPFATLSVYANYTSSPTRNWNAGISFGVYLPAPNFLR